MSLTEEQIEKGYWYWRPKSDFPPEGKILSEYDGEQSYNLIITPGHEKDSVIKKREKSYPNDIPSMLSSVQILWANRINQEAFDAICSLNNLQSLYVQSNRIKDISKIQQLTNLEHLKLIDLTKVGSIDPITELVGLKTLEFENLKKISDFTGVSKLTQLEGLGIDGDMYTAQIIENFEFLKSLKNLKYLTLTNTRATKKDLNPLTELNQLRMFKSSSNYPKEEFKKLKNLSSLTYIGGNIEPLIKT